MRTLIAIGLLPSPALAATGPFFSLNNTDFVVTLGFLVFVGVLIYLNVPKLLTAQLDKRAEGIRSDLAEARELREEAQTLLASYERKQKDVQAQADRIVVAAREEAKAQAEKSRIDMETALDRRLKAAKDQIESAEEKAVREVRDRAVQVAIGAAREVLMQQMDDQRADHLVDRSIETLDAKLH